MTPQEANELALIALRMTEQRVICKDAANRIKESKFVILDKFITAKEKKILDEAAIILMRIAEESNQRDIVNYHKQLFPEKHITENKFG